MPYRILVTLDGSPFAEEALACASDQAHKFGGLITLLSIVTPDPPLHTLVSSEPMWSVPFDLFAAETAGRVNERFRYLKTVSTKVRSEGQAASGVVLSGARADLSDFIVRYSIENSFDLVVMATHGHSGWKRLLFGSITQEVARKSSVPVLVVRPAIPPREEKGLLRITEELAPTTD